MYIFVTIVSVAMTLRLKATTRNKMKLSKAKRANVNIAREIPQWFVDLYLYLTDGTIDESRMLQAEYHFEQDKKISIARAVALTLASRFDCYVKSRICAVKGHDIVEVYTNPEYGHSVLECKRCEQQFNAQF